MHLQPLQNVSHDILNSKEISVFHGIPFLETADLQNKAKR